ncbi:MAG: hypothetical protein K2N24_07320, partial [Lachnospiraceae bacterium]|nr:hypothetical protein [Lachnospiraceae bacterium]
LPMDVKVAKANEEILSGNSQSAVRMTALNFIAQYTEEGGFVSKDILSLPEDRLYLPAEGRIAVALTVQITNPASEITETNYVYTLPNGMVTTGQGTTSILDSNGVEIGSMTTSDTTMTLRFNERVLENADTTANLELYGRIPAVSSEENAECMVYFPILASNSSRGITITNSVSSMNVALTEEDGEDLSEEMIPEEAVSDLSMPEIVGEDVPLALAAGGTDIFDNTTITLPNIGLKASYKNEDGTTTVVELTQNDSFNIPYDAEINMELNFVLGNGTAIDKNKTYTYRLPDTIRVDVEADHPLEDPATGKSIGTVHISKDGTLTFRFDTDTIGSNKLVPFYVRFAGGFSEDMQESGKHADIKFPTETGTFDVHIDTTDSNESKEDKEPGDVFIQKSGAQVISVNGRNYIEWTVALGLNGRETLDGVIHDTLPAGLTYAAVPGYPTVNKDGGKGTVSTSAADGATQVDIKVTDCHPYYRTNVKFCTYYDETLFGSSITENTSALVNNTAVFNPSDGTNGVESNGSVRITPDMVSKSGSAIDADGNITWTVTLNREKLELNGTTYKDTLGTGLELIDGSISASAGTVSTSGNGFQVSFNSSTKVPVTITYKTKVTDFTQSTYQNTATLTGGKYNVHKDAYVNGLPLLTKSCQDYNSITKTFTWQIVVNSAKQDLTNVVVTDTFDSNMMKFVSASVPLAAGSNAAGGTLKFAFDSLNNQKIITVVTRVNPNYESEYDWVGFKNHAEMISDMNSTPVPADAERYVQLSVPDLIDKSGIIKGDGTVEWTVVVNAPQLKVEGMSVTDVLPENMAYLPGSFTIQNRYWDNNPVKKNPTVGTDPATGRETITYNFPKSDSELSRFFNQEFVIKYLTRITDMQMAEESHSYKNDVEFTVDYEGNVTVKDEENATVTGVVGGVLDKEYSYQNGRNYVDWTVRINGARNDMSSIENPKISDELADYFDYVSGTLYKVTENGRVQVPAKAYKATCVNRNLVVQLPNIGSDCYEFVFRTSFNVTAAELEGMKISNRVEFAGDGTSIEKESSSVENVNFSSSSAGSAVKREIRVLKRDSADGTPLEGARFELYLGDECIGEAVSDKDGVAVFEGLLPMAGYTFRLKETEAPSGYEIDGTGETSISNYTDANMKVDANGVRYYEIIVKNTKEEEPAPATGSITIKKVNEAGAALSGAQFGLYQDAATKTLLATKTTGANGKVTFTDLEAGTYYVKETKSPAGYTLNNSVITAVITVDADGNVVTSYNGTAKTEQEIKDTAAVGSLTIKKINGASGAALSGATFGLYTDALCSDRVDSKTTNASGEVIFNNLELGKTYYYREDKAPTGYVSDYTIYSVVVGTGKETVNVSKNATVENVLAVGNLVVKKVDNSVPAKPLSGVEFTLYAKNGTTKIMGPVTTDSNGTAVFSNVPFGEYVLRETKGKAGYAVASDVNVTIDHLGDTNATVVNDVIKFNVRIVKQDSADSTVKLEGAEFGLFTQGGVRVKKDTTDENGIIEFTDIVYGNYYIQELNAPEGYILDNTKIPISAASITINGQVIEQTVGNEKENGSILVHKQDEDGNPLAGAEFTLYDSNGFVKGTAMSMTADEAAAAGTSFNEGDVYFDGLPFGTYYVRETKAPDTIVTKADGTKWLYVRDDKNYEVQVVSNTTIAIDRDGNPLTITNELTEIIIPVVSFKIKKTNSETNQPVSGAVFELYKNGKPTGITRLTGTDGMAYFRQISVNNDSPNTVYTLVETGVPNGYVAKKNTTVITLANNLEQMQDRYLDDKADPKPIEEIAWAGVGNTEKNGTITNDPIKGSIQITKTGTVSTILLQNAEFTLYTDAACKNKVSITGVTNPVKTNASGVAVFSNLPIGTYYVKETKAPKGYALSDTVTRVVINSTVRQDITLRDTPLNVRISKQSLNGTDEVPGARLTVTKKGSTTPIDSWTSTTEPHKIPISVLEAGQTYVLTETLAPNGYGYSEAIEFTVNLDGSITTAGKKNGQTIIMQDRQVSLSVTKVDEHGAVLTGAILAIYDANNKEIDRWTSGDLAHRVEAGKLVAPASGYNRYTLREISAPYGYEVAEPIPFAVGSNGKLYQIQGGTYTEIPDGRLTMQDEPIASNTIYIRKLDGMSQLGLAGATFELSSTNENFETITWESSETQKRITLTPESEDEVFTLKEISAPDGYVLADAVQFRIVDGKVVLLSGTDATLNNRKDTINVMDQRLIIRVRKQNGYGTLLNGAVLRLSEYDTQTSQKGAQIAEFTSNSAAPEVIEFAKLVGGQTYILEEIEAPEGYQLAEDIIFTLNEKGKITRADGIMVVNNTVIMQDEEAGLGVRKIDRDDQSGLAGSTLMLTSQDDPFFTTQTWVSDGKTKTWDFIDFTPGCTYTLTEVNAPDGYDYADPIVFTVGKEDNLIYVDDKVQPNRTVYIADGKIRLSVSKQDVYDRIEVPGAELAIVDEDGNTVVSWITGSTAQEVDTSRLIAGKDDYKEYTLHEVKVPNGYYPAEDIPFAIDRNGLIYTVSTGADGQKTYELADENLLIMYEEPKFSISKQNIAGEEVPGATLTVTAKDDKSFATLTWVSGEEPRYFESGFFQPGVTYVLTETNAPAGYAYSESVEFRLDEDGKIYVNGKLITNKKVIMVDDLITVYISKQDMTNSKELPGASLVIKNEAGEIIYSFVSTNEPTLIPSEIFTAPKKGSLSYYTLTEITAPDGYEIAETIAFAIDSTGKIYVKNEQGEYLPLTGDAIVMLDYPNGTHSRPGVPKTGDRMPLALVLLLGLSGLFGACMIWKGKESFDFF